ncbi:MAG: hypothetical protein QOE33_2379 [Acidobacteriota bacterium]|nr:hypothetical protein [Acidobacteriota bacterium]
MEISKIATALKALRNQIVRWRGFNPHHHIGYELGMEFFERFWLLAEKVKLSEPSLYEDFPRKRNPHKLPGEMINSNSVDVLLTDIECALDILSGATTVDIPSMNVTREGIFFAGQYFDAIQHLSMIIEQATQDIVIIDGYINEKLLSLLTVKVKGVKVRILTKSRAIKPVLIVSATDFNSQYGGLVIRTSESFHDRFVIIDDKDFYHFGASLGDLGKRGFMFSIIEEPLITQSLVAEFNKEWAGASVVI